MNWIDYFAVVRILAYAIYAAFALQQRRWWVWATFTVLVLSTYAYAFTDLTEVVVEVLRTLVAAGLIYISLRRK